MKRVLILGAAGRDFHNFNVLFRDNPDYRVVAFTAAQIPNIEGRTYPPALAGTLYPQGVPILEENRLESLVRDEHIDVAVFSYSDVSYQTVMHLASRVVAAGTDFWLVGAERTMLRARVPVISVCAVRTGSGKSPLSRWLVRELTGRGWKPVVVRHPMPYGDLEQQRVQRFASLADLERQKCTIEECEEYEPHIAQGAVVYAGVDYGEILRAAQQEADLILWDGGNNDTPFYRPDLEVVVADPHRAGHELAYYPGEVNLRRAQVVVINKADTASPEDVGVVRANTLAVNPGAAIVEAACLISAPAEQLRGKRVLVVEDGPTLTHGEMSYGAGVLAADRSGAAERVDPRPYASGSIRQVFERFRHLGALLPAMGYGETQRHELEETINRVPCDVVVVATPVDLARILHLNKPSVRVTYEIASLGEPRLEDVLEQFIHKCQPAFSHIA